MYLILTLDLLFMHLKLKIHNDYEKEDCVKNKYVFGN